MRDYEELVKALWENAEWAEENIWEVPIMLPDNLKQAADAIEELSEDNAALNGVVTNLLEQLADVGKTFKWISVEDENGQV